MVDQCVLELAAKQTLAVLRDAGEDLAINSKSLRTAKSSSQILTNFLQEGITLLFEK